MKKSKSISQTKQFFYIFFFKKYKMMVSKWRVFLKLFIFYWLNKATSLYILHTERILELITSFFSFNILPPLTCRLYLSLNLLLYCPSIAAFLVCFTSTYALCQLPPLLRWLYLFLHLLILLICNQSQNKLIFYGIITNASTSRFRYYYQFSSSYVAILSNY